MATAPQSLHSRAIVATQAKESNLKVLLSQSLHSRAIVATELHAILHTVAVVTQGAHHAVAAAVVADIKSDHQEARTGRHGMRP